MRLDIYHHPAVEIAQKLDAILHKLTRMENQMATDAEVIDALTADVAKQATVVDGIATLLSSVKTQLAEALAGEQLSAAARAKLAAIMPLLEANTQKLSDAIVANTDVAPPTTPPVVAPDPSPAGQPTTDSSGVTQGVGDPAPSSSGSVSSGGTVTP